MSDETREPAALVPLEERAVAFHEDTIRAAAVEVAGERRIYVPIRPIVEYLGLDWSAQRQRIMRDEVLAEAVQGVVITTTPSESGAGGGPQEMLCLPVEMMHGWLFGISANRVGPELREKVLRYRRDCFRVLWEAFESETLAQEAPPATPLAQIRKMGLAIARMAEQQMLLEGRVDAVDARLDRAAAAFGALQRRLGAVERRLTPASFITDEQAQAIAATVKALAELLTSKGPNTNHYQRVFAELYRRFGVSSYKLIRQEQYEAVLAFLEAWRVSAEEANP
ncbi:MAG: ORF6C domain-containing protein [Ardenticatenaceae bacterium]|nr:ORF6C domain-containing protein [Ardenticatenaceae bacterium]